MTIPAPSGVAQPDAPISAPGYAIAPNAVLRDARLSRDARLLYVLLDGHAGARGRVRVGDAVLAAELGVSERSLYRYMAELVGAELIARKGTGRSSITTVHNGIRTPARVAPEVTAVAVPLVGSDTAGSAEVTPVAALQRSKSREVTDNREHGASPALSASVPAPTSRLEPAAGGRLEPYLRAVIEGAGVDIELNQKVRGSLEKIAAAGIKPEQLRELVAGWPRISWSGEPIHRLAGFIVGVVLPGIAEGQQAPTARPETPLPSLPPTPQQLRELDRQRELRETQDAALAESMDELLVLADQYGIESPVRGAAAARAALRSAGVPA
jgi:hypothetical protein